MIKALILDLNGIFIKTPHFSDRFENKFSVPKEEFYPVMTGILKTVRQEKIEDSFVLWEPHLKNWNINLTKEEFFSFWFEEEKLDTELLEFVNQKRKQGLKIFILSNNFRERTTFYRETYPSIFTSVDAAYFSWETGNIKPDKQAFESVLKEQSLEPDEVLFFDDSEKNVAGAKELGIRAEIWPGLQKVEEIIEANQD